MAEIDETASKSDNAKKNASIAATKLGEAMENLPSNESVLHNLNKVKVELDKAKTAPEIDNTGRRLLQDAELLVDDMKILVKERNEGDRMQEIAREAKLASEVIGAHSQDLGSHGKGTVQGMDTNRIQAAAKDGFKSVQLAITEIVRSSEFRQELMDFFRFASDVFRSGVKDSRGGRRRRQHHDSDSDYSSGSGYDSDSYTGSDSGSYTDSESDSGSDYSDIAAEQRMYSEAHSRRPRTKNREVPDRVTDAKDTVQGTINDQLGKLNMPQRVELTDEQIEELVNRFFDIMRSIADRPRTREAFMGIMGLIDLFTYELNQNSGHFRYQAKDSAATVRDDDHVRRLIFLVREEIEQFTGGRSVKPFFRHYKQVFRILRSDETTRTYFTDLWNFISKIVQQPELMDRQETTEEARYFIKRSRSLENREVGDHISDSFREGRRIMKRITQDPVLQRMRADFGRLIDDITKDSYGKFTLDGDVWNQLRLILTYSVIERVRIPLPPIESEDEKRQYRVKDVVLNLRDFVPETVTLEDHARVQFDVRDIRHPTIRKTRNVFHVSITNIHFSVHDADIWFRRKRAPHMETSLKADIDIGFENKRGLDLVIDLVSKPGSPGIFAVDRVNATVNNIKIHVADTSMAFMYNAVLKIIKGRIASRLERSIEEGIRNGLETLNRVLIERVSDPARRAAHRAGDKAGETDFTDLLRRFGETPLGMQAKRGIHMAKGDTAAGKRDRRHAKRNVRGGAKVGQEKLEQGRDMLADKIGEHQDKKERSRRSHRHHSSKRRHHTKRSGHSTKRRVEPVVTTTGSAPVQHSEYSTSYVDRSNPAAPVLTQECERCFVSKDGNTTTQTVVKQEQISYTDI
eukprot:TRINITY_DN16202_c0_g1_i1.p1 TRINITY_DN16202_c0_g1~~TRINITY_DN16202_c0_g1_i1.p1  ORF type:complete len:859 (-),score=189.49 TRINITY_DN16202_c0_g1_i1:97-2673(-)